MSRVAALPSNSAILYIMLSPAVVGIPQDEDTAIAALHGAAAAPIFSYTDVYLGKGIVGGPLISGEEQGRKAGAIAVRLLSGENPTDIKTAPIAFGTPKYDWRELQRWRISESDLPPGSEVLFREPSAWQRYRWQMLATGLVLALQTVLILALLQERKRRRTAEMDAQLRLGELAHVNRRSVVGELSASITHELAQPLGAILHNTETAEILLQAPTSLDVGELKEIMADIGRDQRRASEVIRRLRNLLAKAPTETREVDVNAVVREVFDLLRSQAAAQQVSLDTSLAPGTLSVMGDGIQLEQVILNLVMNSVEAIRGSVSLERRIVARTKRVDGGSAEIEIEDSGPGIPLDKALHIFEPFFTTKESGMGMGLSIARTIVERHKGRIWAEGRPAGGAVVRFTIPLAEKRWGSAAPANEAFPAISPVWSSNRAGGNEINLGLD